MDTPRDDAAAIDALLPALKRGEHEAFHELHDLMAGQLLAYGHARLGDRGVAEDVVQDVFLRLVKHARRFRGDGRALLAWLYRTASRRCTDMHRKRGRLRELFMPRLPDTAVHHDDFVSIDPLVEAALRELTDEQREAVVLRRIIGLSGDEVAVIMRRDRNAVYALCARGETQLRDRLDQRALPAPRSERLASDQVEAESAVEVGSAVEAEVEDTASVLGAEESSDWEDDAVRVVAPWERERASAGSAEASAAEGSAAGQPKSHVRLIAPGTPGAAATPKASSEIAADNMGEGRTNDDGPWDPDATERPSQ